MMSDVATNPALEGTPDPGLAKRLIGVVFSPREAYTAVAAHPRWFGALAVSGLIFIAANVIFQSTEVGKALALEQQIQVLKAFGQEITPEALARMQSQMRIAPYMTGGSLLVGVPLGCAVVAGLLLAIFTVATGGGATFRQMYAVVAHSMVIGAIQQVFSIPIMYAREDMASPTRLAVMAPMLDEMGFLHYLLSAIDLFQIWSLISTSIGVAVLYKWRTGPVAAILFGIYAVIVVIIAAVRAF
jgi:hypothetical protein